jgi:hypothetical protein
MIKDIQLSERLPGLQNILRAEFMAIYTVIKLSITIYTKEPIYIFIDSLNSLYLINTQIRHPSQHNNHPDKIILSHKVKVHTNITGNETADELAKRGRLKAHSLLAESHEFAHASPYYLHKDEWIGMHYTPYKGPIHNFQNYLKQHTTDTRLKKLAGNFPNIHKWTSDTNIDNISSNTF